MGEYAKPDVLVETDQPVPDEDTWVEAVVTWTGGFVEEGREREAAYVGGAWHDDLIMGVLEHEAGRT